MKRASLGAFCGLGLVYLALAACGGGSVPGDDPDPPIAGLLSQVSDPEDLENSIKQGLTAVRSAEEVAVAADAAGAAGNFTGTYTLEQNVDELDAVRYDGAHLYVAPRRYYNCCFILEDTAAGAGPPTTPERSIRILATDPAAGTAQSTGSIPLEDGVSVQGMYLDGDRMVALTGTAFYGMFGQLWADFAVWAPETLGYRIYDVSDPAAPQAVFDAEIDGTFVASRRIGNIVYIVSRYTPYIDGLEYYVTNAAQQAANQAILNSVSLDDLLPKITVNGTTRSLVAPDRCYITTPATAAGPTSGGYPVLTSVTAIPIDNPDAFSTTCYNEDTYGVYVSERSIYFTQLLWDAANSRNQTRIHKFALAGTSLNYRGSAEIDGQVWSGGQADFRMNEHAGDLRVFASQFDRQNVDFVDHSLYVLRESSTRPDLEVVAALPNDQRPEEIGKPNEALYGVRFMPDRAYAVTFERIDPLYVIDLADAEDPFIAGELEVTGFSDFLHPVNDDLLLGLGRGGNGGLKLELFDVSDITQPLSRGSALLGRAWSQSEAMYDRHAFTYQVLDDSTDRFAIPAEIYGVDGQFSFDESGLYLFEIRDKDRPGLASLNSVGSITPPRDGITIPYSSRNRSFIHDDTVYFVRDETVWSAFWSTPTMINGPY